MNYQELPKLPTELPKLPKLPPLPVLPKLPPIKEMLARPVDPVQQPDTPPPKTTPETPEENKAHVDNFGWIKNLPESTIKYVKSIVFDLPKAVLESGAHYAKDPDQYTKDLALVFQKHNGLGRFFKENMVDYYTDGFWKNFNEDPAHALGDVAALASLGGGLIGKAGEMGNLAKVARLGGRIAATGEYLDPINWAAKGAAKVAAPALEAIGFGEHTPEWLGSIRAPLRAQHSAKAADDVARLIQSRLSPAENALVERNVRVGFTHELEALAKDETSPVGRWHKTWREIVTGGDEPKFKSLNTLDDEMAKNANSQKAAEYSMEHFHEMGLQKPWTPKEARALMDAGVINPTFMSTYRMRGGAMDFFEAMNEAHYRGGVLSRFEKAGVSKKPKMIDMDAVAARQIAAREDALYKINVVNATEQLMKEKGKLIFVPNGGDESLVPKTHAPLQSAFFKKYFGDELKTGEANLRLLSSADTPANGILAAEKLIKGNPEIMRAVAGNGTLYAPKHVVALLLQELAPVSKFGRMYDRLMGHFKGLATVWNPRFWGSVVFGNSMLGLLYGISPDAVRMAFKLGGDMPAELKNIARHEIYLRDKGIFTRYSAHLGEFAQQLDQMFRLPIFVSEVGREAHAKLLSTGRDFFLAQADLAKAVKLYGAAPGKLVEMRLAVQQLERELAAKTPKMLSLQRQMMGIGEQIQARRFSNKVEFDRLANAYGRIEARYKEAMADQVRRLADIGALHQRIPQMRLEAAVADRAIMAGNRLFGSYARLNPFERTILRRILPFYTFNKAMTSLAFRLPYIYPKRAFVGAHLAQAWFDITSDDNAYMPARLRNYVPVAALADGSVVAISAAYLNPMGGVRVGNVAELPVPSAYNPLTAHPVIQLAFRMAGAIPEWSSKPLSPGAYATRLDNGTVIQWTGNGFKTTIAQPSVFKSIADLFPQAQLIDKLLHPYAQTDRGWLFNPEPILGPDGKPRYPKELVDILLSNVIPTQTYNRDEVRSVEQAKMAAVIKSYIKDLKYASPDRRQQILDVLNGWKEEKNRKWVN